MYIQSESSATSDRLNLSDEGEAVFFWWPKWGWQANQINQYMLLVLFGLGVLAQVAEGVEVCTVADLQVVTQTGEFFLAGERKGPSQICSAPRLCDGAGSVSDTDTSGLSSREFLLLCFASASSLYANLEDVGGCKFAHLNLI